MRKLKARLTHLIVTMLFADSTRASEIANQSEAFQSLGLNREAGLEKIDNICLAKFGKRYNEFNGMWSEHLVLLSAISISKPEVKSILEIGTFKGETSSLMSELFSEAKIETLDLSRQEILEDGTYAYAIDQISENNSQHLRGNITYQIMNSLFLTFRSAKYDLIWVDGNHTLPVSTIDITNSIRLLSKDGVAICDDVYVKKNPLDQISDTTSHETLLAFEDCGIITFSLLNKRLSTRFNNVMVPPKFLGIYQLSAENS
jgi:predicted O-methyltransferase YrrM